ncbi:MAG TPA: hypothetical protein H9700_04290 [Candidatus Eisenbergiella intestinipullorum]|nr:hypothetical protein [Candidatus Eisenbergiella intestinipullorum]
MENMMKEKKMILIASISGGAALLILLTALVILIGSTSRSAAGAARTFEALLSEGKLAELEACCYLPDTGQAPALSGESGESRVRFTTPAELAQHFGADAVLAGHDASPEEELLPVIMRYSSLRVSTGMVIGSRASAALTLTGPDFTAWTGGSGGEEASAAALPESLAAALLASGDDLPEVLEACLADGSVPLRTVTLRIPMRKQDGSWRFAVSRETEDAWFGGLLLMGTGRNG